MADKNNQGTRRFVYHISDKNNNTTYLPLKTRSKYNMPTKVVQSGMSPPQLRPKLTESPSSMKNSPTPRQRNSNLDTSRTEPAPVRRVVVVRNTKNPQTKQGPVDIGDFGQANPKPLPVLSNGKTSIYLIRRSITTQDPVG